MPDATRPNRELKILPPRKALPDDPSTSRLIAGQRDLTPAPDPTSLVPPANVNPLLRLPPYLQLVRKESRLRQDQADELARTVRHLNQARRGSDGGVSGERITDNTLIRVAVDLLLDRTDQLRGTTEAELRKSLGL